MKNKNFITLIFVFFALSGIKAQQFVSGTIYETTTNNQEKPLAGANVYWLNSKIGTITNNKGLLKYLMKVCIQN